MTAMGAVTLADGRQVGVHHVEGPSGRTVVLGHAAPGSGAFDPDPEATWARGVTLIGIDRPGYGRSDPVPSGEWPTIAGAADELAEVLDQLGVGPIGVAGWSVGGLVALALAARRPDLVDRVVVIGAPAPPDQIDWLPADLKNGIEALRGQPAELVRQTLIRLLTPVLSEDPRRLIGLLGAEGADDPASARPGAPERLRAMLHLAFAQGAVGLAADIVRYYLRPWGFEPAQVKAKTLLLYGANDPIAGPRHGKWYQQRLPTSRYEQVPASDHLLILAMWRRALSHLAPGRKR